MGKKIFSGVQPTGNLHLGNYLGAIKNFVELNNNIENKLIYEYNFKFFYLILSAFLSLIFYLSFSLFIKAFKYGDIKLKY